MPGIGIEPFIAGKASRTGIPYVPYRIKQVATLLLGAFGLLLPFVPYVPFVALTWGIPWKSAI
jgi:hypothetical protein